MESEILLFKIIIKKLVHIHIRKLKNLQENWVRSIEFSKNIWFWFRTLEFGWNSLFNVAFKTKCMLNFLKGGCGVSCGKNNESIVWFTTLVWTCQHWNRRERRKFASLVQSLLWWHTQTAWSKKISSGF